MNICCNSLTVTGRGISTLLDSIQSKKSKFDFRRVKPYPFTSKFHSWGLRRSKISGSTQGWDGWNYKWCCENWGTMTPGVDAVIHKFKGAATITFATTMAPPTPIIAKLSKQFPKLCFELEFGNGSRLLAGRARWSKGKLEHEEYATKEIQA